MFNAPTPIARPRELSSVVVEDQTLFREMLGNMLNMRGGLRVAGSAQDIAGGKEACDKHNPDLLVIDLDLPDGSGLEVATHLLKHNPEARVIIVSGQTSDFVCPRWLDKNLQAIVSKDDTFASLRKALDEILALENTVARPREKKVFIDKPLTPREAEIFALIGEGLTSKEIGSRLNLSGHTIQAHRKRIAIKLSTKGSELVQRAIAQRQSFLP